MVFRLPGIKTTKDTNLIKAKYRDLETTTCDYIELDTTNKNDQTIEREETKGEPANRERKCIPTNW